MWAGSPKRDTQGTGPLGGCGQSPPVSPRDGCENEAVAGRAGSFRRARSAPVPRAPGASASPRRMRANTQSGFSPSSRRACQPFLKGKSPPKQHFSANQPKPGAPHSSAFAPPGQTASPPHPAAPLAPLGQGSVAPRAAVPAHHHSSTSAASARPALPSPPTSPSPKNRRLCPPPLHQKRKEAPMPPARGA